MTRFDVTTLDGGRSRLDGAAVEGLRASFGAQLLEPGHADYDAARRVWNGMIDRRPALIVRCRAAADVAAAVRFARAHRLRLAVRGGGHNVAGFATCDGGLVIDLSPMRGVSVDPEARTAKVMGGATWGDVDRATQPFALAAPGGIVSTTGVSGLTLGGGQGWLRRTYGMSCDNLLSVDVVTAEGKLLVVSEAQNRELFWALRGGGGNFGVATELEFRLHPVGPDLAFAGPIYPLESAPEVLAGMRRLARDAPDELNVSATCWSIPAVPGFPSDLHGRPVVVLGAIHVGPPSVGEKILKPLRELGQPLLDLSGNVQYLELQQMFDPYFPASELRYYWKSLYLAGLDDDAIRTVAEFAASRPSSRSMVGLWKLGGALGRVEASATAAGARDAPYLLEILANWSSEADSDANIAWARELFAAMQPFGTGKPNFNFPGHGNEPGFVRAAIGGNWDRLVEIKRRYDPSNLFRLNQNVDPRGTASQEATDS